MSGSELPISIEEWGRRYRARMAEHFVVAGAPQPTAERMAQADFDACDITDLMGFFEDAPEAAADEAINDYAGE
jgi:hypothetical protein